MTIFDLEYINSKDSDDDSSSSGNDINNNNMDESEADEEEEEQEGEIEVRRQEQPRRTIVRAFARSPGIRRAFNRFAEATKSAHRISLQEESDSVVIERCYL